MEKIWHHDIIKCLQKNKSLSLEDIYADITAKCVDETPSSFIKRANVDS